MQSALGSAAVGAGVGGLGVVVGVCIAGVGAEGMTGVVGIGVVAGLCIAGVGAEGQAGIDGIGVCTALEAIPKFGGRFVLSEHG